MRRGRVSFAKKLFSIGVLTFQFWFGLSVAHAEESVQVEVMKTNGCGCCILWIDHMKENGFSVTSHDMSMGALTQFKVANGIGPGHASCHTAKIEGYTVEGHVPAQDVDRLLDERPDAIGLAVPGMPLGSPGMEFGNERDAFDVLLVLQDGSTEIYASYPTDR